MVTIHLDPEKIYTCPGCGSHKINHVVPGCIAVYPILSISREGDGEAELDEGTPAIGETESEGWFECDSCGAEVPANNVDELFDFLAETKEVAGWAKAVAKEKRKKK